MGKVLGRQQIENAGAKEVGLLKFVYEASRRGLASLHFCISMSEVLVNIRSVGNLDLGSIAWQEIWHESGECWGTIGR